MTYWGPTVERGASMRLHLPYSRRSVKHVICLRNQALSCVATTPRGIVIEIKFSRAMKKAWVWLSLYLLSLVLLRLMRPSEPTEVKLVLFVTAILNPAVLLYLIRLVRHQGPYAGAAVEAPALNTCLPIHAAAARLSNGCSRRSIQSTGTLRKMAV